MDPHVKAELLLRMIRGETTRADACRQHGLEPSEVDAWMAAFLEGGRRALNGREPGAAGASPAAQDLHTLIDTIPTLVWKADTAGSAQFFNRRWLEYTGTSAEQVLGSGWTRALHPDDVERVVERWRAIAASGEPGMLEARLRRHDGTYRWFLFRAAPSHDAQGNLVCWYGTNTDIEDLKRAESALRESEQQFRLIVDCLPGLVATMSAEGEVEHVNQRILDYGGTTLDGLRDWRPFVHPDDLARATVAWRHAVETGEPYDIEHRVRGGDGVHRWFHVRGLPLRDRDGRVLRWYILFADIEDRKHAEQALRRSETELARITRIVMMGELTASIAHEVNQPLTAVAHNADACLVMISTDDPPLGDIRDALVDIVGDAHRASAVIARVRQSATKAPLDRTLLDLRDVVADVLALARHQSDACRVTLLAEGPYALPPVLGDRVQLQQVLLNLVVNAIDASRDVEEPERIVTIRVHHRLREEMPEVVVAVRDVGVGITDDAMSHLFDAFYTTKPQGMGMGLVISRSIVVAHGGQLWVERNEGRGTTFAFSLPTRCD